MIEHRRGNILDSEADLIVIPVNTVGVMGAGLAKAAARKWPHLERGYRNWCRRFRPSGGGLCVPFPEERPTACLLATKEHWRDPSRLGWVAVGLDRLADYVDWKDVPSIALPMLGCGLGGLRETDVLPMIEAAFGAGPRVVEVWHQ